MCEGLPDSLKLTAKNKHKENLVDLNDYYDSFAYRLEDTDKRFIRFMDKVRKSIYSEVKDFYTNLFSTRIMPVETTDMESFVASICMLSLMQQLCLFEENEDDESYISFEERMAEMDPDLCRIIESGDDTLLDDGRCLLDILHNYVEEEPNIDKVENQKIIGFLIDIFTIRKNGRSRAEEIVAKEFTSAIRLYIAQAQMRDGTIDDGNYVIKAMPETVDKLIILDNLTNWTCIDIIRIYKKEFQKELEEIEMQQFVDSVNVETETLKKEVADLSEECVQIKKLLEEEKNKNKQLMEKIAQKEQLEEDKRKEREQERLDFVRTNRKLTERYEKMEEKYERLKQSITIEKEKDDLEMLPEIQLDYQAKYVFVAHENTAFQQNLLNIFPNAIFLQDVSAMSNNTADMVVCITRHIAHDAYYGIKEICRQKEIPFLHTVHTNCSFIESMIINYYSQKEAEEKSNFCS